MARHRDFDMETREDPLTFTLLGQSFTCIPEAPAGVLMDFVDAASPGGARAASALIAFLEGVVVDSCAVCVEAEPAPSGLARIGEEDGIVVPDHECVPDVERLRRLLHSKDTVVPINLLGDLVMWVAEEYTGRPTQPSSVSSSGRGRTTATSTAGSRSPGSRASTG